MERLWLLQAHVGGSIVRAGKVHCSARALHVPERFVCVEAIPRVKAQFLALCFCRRQVDVLGGSVPNGKPQDDDREYFVALSHRRSLARLTPGIWQLESHF